VIPSVKRARTRAAIDAELAVDFDKARWQSEVRAFWETCDELDLHTAVERSRSGNRAHVWLFFENPTPAGGPVEAMSRRPISGQFKLRI